MNNNHSFTVLASAARTATVSKEIPNNGWRGLILCVNATAETATASVTPSLQAKNEAGEWQTIWTAAAAIEAVGTFTYLLYPGASGGNFTEVDGIPLPLELRLVMTHADADALTYSIRGHWLI